MQLGITVVEQTETVQAANPGADAEAVTGEPECVLHSLTGEAGAYGGFPGAAEVERGSGVGTGGVGPGAAPDDVDGDDDEKREDEEDDGGVVVEVPADAVT